MLCHVTRTSSVSCCLCCISWCTYDY